MDIRHLSELLEDAALARPDHPAVEDEHGGRLTYAELLARPTGWQPGSHAGESAAAIESASGFPRVSRPSRRFTASCGSARPMYRSIRPDRPFARR